MVGHLEYLHTFLYKSYKLLGVAGVVFCYTNFLNETFSCLFVLPLAMVVPYNLMVSLMEKSVTDTASINPRDSY